MKIDELLLFSLFSIYCDGGTREVPEENVTVHRAIWFTRLEATRTRPILTLHGKEHQNHSIIYGEQGIGTRHISEKSSPLTYFGISVR